MRPAELATLSTAEARLVVVPAGLALLGSLGPDRLSRLPSPCLVRRVFGRCPSCGVSRAMAALLRGDLQARPRRGLGALVLATLGWTLAADVHHVWSRRGPP